MIVCEYGYVQFRDRPIYRFADIFGRYRYIGIGKLDIGIGKLDIGSVISVSVSVSVLANVDIGYIGIGKISVKIHRYRPNIGEISAKCQILAKISVK